MVLGVNYYLLLSVRFNNFFLLVILINLLFLSCSDEKADTLFVLRNDIGIDFANNLTYTEEFNPYTYRNFYNGGGVALGDINNDGLIDIYFTGNQVENKLYLNKGNWKFEDITLAAGVSCPDVWSSGANFVDINSDGFLDLYVCKAGKPEGGIRHNELFINNGDVTFTESSAEYGLNITGLGIHSAFFDYDRDGDLDCYLLNNSMRSVAGFNLDEGTRGIPTNTGNKLLQNRDGKYYDVSTEAGIYTSSIGYGLGITLSDFNSDLWPDIYISNDFFEKDYLYINQQDGTFKEEGDKYMESMSLGSMGADAADLNNDGSADLMVTEMHPSSTETRKTNAIYDSWKKYKLSESKGYGHQQPRNTLQRNLDDSTFVEVGRLSGIESTDWSWSSLIADYDNDGLKDIFVSNGVYKDLLDRDYLTFTANNSRVKSLINSRTDAIKSLIDTMPSRAVSNFMFKNKGDFQFDNVTDAWGLGEKTFSNGCAYADLDNDGDLDLVVNNVNMPGYVYENTADKLGRNYVSIKLVGEEGNRNVIGAKVFVGSCDNSLLQEQYPSRGFESSMSNILTFGLGDCDSVNLVYVTWPDGNSTRYEMLAANQLHTLSSFDDYDEEIEQEPSRFSNEKRVDKIRFTHKENNFNHFDKERILYKMNTEEGPAIELADFNNDGIKDMFVGGAKGQSSGLFLSKGTDYIETSYQFTSENKSEVVEVISFDSDNDGDLDLYVAHGGSAFSQYSYELDDVIYVNDGKGNFEKKKDAIQFPKRMSTGGVAITDYDGDGLKDIFVASRNSHLSYGTIGNGYLFHNEGENKYTQVDSKVFENLGMVTSAAWLDADQDGDKDILVVGEFMEIKLFLNQEGSFVESSKKFGLAQTSGIWNTILVHDFNQDGKEDFFVGNVGLNTSLTTDHLLCINDFDRNGSTDPILCISEDGKYIPILDMDELISQVPGVKKKFVYYADYAKMSMNDIFGQQLVDEAKKFELDVLESRMYLSNGNGYSKVDLPIEIQYSSVFAASALMRPKKRWTGLLEEEGIDEVQVVYLGGNNYNIKPQYGREDASRGWELEYKVIDGKIKFEKEVNSLQIEGEIRDIEFLDNATICIGINDEKIKCIRI